MLLKKSLGCCWWKGSHDTANPSSSYFGLILFRVLNSAKAQAGHHSVFPLYSYDKLRKSSVSSGRQCYLFGFCSVHL
ncbi:hypothetical protein MKX03_005269 [Papaver bracteatum]|nr:hypothetical protein MKX03_005269 [Papaver bracteatum]